MRARRLNDSGNSLRIELLPYSGFIVVKKAAKSLHKVLSILRTNNVIEHAIDGAVVHRAVLLQIMCGHDDAILSIRIGFVINRHEILHNGNGHIGDFTKHTRNVRLMSLLGPWSERLAPGHINIITFTLKPEYTLKTRSRNVSLSSSMRAAFGSMSSLISAGV